MSDTNIYECAECEWIGLHEQKAKEQIEGTMGLTDVCPNCGCQSFYIINETIE